METRIMWSVIGLGIVTLFIIFITHWFYKWNNPKCNGVLPPGFMGFPLVGETLQFIMPSRSIDIHPFIKTRIQRYGAVFRTSLVGRPLVVSADPEFNSFIFQQEGNAVEMWYLDSFSQIFDLDGESRFNSVGCIHKYVRSKVLNQFGPESLKETLLPQLEKMVHKTLSIWPSQASIEVKQATATMVFDFTAKQMFGHDYEKSLEQISDTFANFLQGLISFPLNIPGTTFHKCMKDKKKILYMINNMLKDKLTSTAETCQGDFLDQAIKDLSSEKFLTEDFIVLLSFGTLFASVESLSTTLTLAFKLLSENPSVVDELRAEHETIIKNRDISDSALTWDEYKSMTFTLQVIDEINRLANVIPGFLRRTLKDIQVNGYTIPAGWMIMVITSALHLDPNTFKDPLAFNPWRWKGMDSIVISKNFMPFGGGLRQCAGAAYAKVFMATFLHVLVTKYRWTKIKGGDVVRAPILGFGDGIQIKVWEKA
ncbi:beta-amyrin 16-alpha-hydroxylase CYP87D16-like [Cornus florida]|uniref:beta-amyrin 16-alpha-hydroxylase CYP87D16-like n=1 Tax=Cornus florida TaxID=4283 RepID=UPI00289D3F4E|nr:beta-amyrin 16-alpha-hydroxylase CYP87D16-like [Cornus florida]